MRAAYEGADHAGVIAEIALALGLLCAVAIAIHLLRHPQKTKIMDAVWPLAALWRGQSARGRT